MMRNLVLAVIFSMLLAAMIGCSQSAPVASDFTPDRVTYMDGHVLWGYFQLYIDPSVPSVEVVPAREALKHFNVKLFLNPPNCNDCIKIVPMGPYQDNILSVEITLKNPKPFAGYDVRGILLSDDEDATLTHPDNYTALFDDGGAVNINPFRAFATLEDDRKFGAGASHKKIYDIFLSKFGKVKVLGYAVDASWPTRAKEPYAMTIPEIEGSLGHLGYKELTITAKVRSAFDDVDEVLLDASSLGFTSDLEFTYWTQEYWRLTMVNSPLAEMGEYPCWVKASTASSTKYLYEDISLTVVEGSVPISLANDVQPIFDQYCISCHMSVGPPLDLDLTEGNTHSNTVGVTATQSFVMLITPEFPEASYLAAKISGNHLPFPFSGSGGRMPKDGPPWVTYGERSIINEWITDGALDN